MTPQERHFLQRLEERTRLLAPELRAAILLAFRLLRTAIHVEEVARLLERGDVDGAVRAALREDAVQRAFRSARERLRDGMVRNAKAALRYVPIRGTPTLGIAFDVLDPGVLDAIRTLESGAIAYTDGTVREAFRAAITHGLEAGVNPRTIAVGLRDVVGLTPHQEGIIGNFQRAVRDGDYAKALTYKLRDKRFDRTLRRLLKEDGTLTPSQVDEMGRAYRRKFVGRNAQTMARTSALEAQRIGQQLAWREAQEAGYLGDAEIIKIWVAVRDARVRPEHNAMHRAEAPLNGTYSTGERYPGEHNPWNCRCTELYRVRRR